MKSPPVQPPRWAQRLLAWLHPSDTLEEVEGDLAELYAYWHGRGPTGRSGKTQATLRYVLSVVSVLPPFVRRRQRKQAYYQQPSILSTVMFRNYVKIAWRNLARNKAFSLINIVGLAVGMACCGVLTLFVLDELSHDQFHKKKNQLHWVWNRTLDNGTMQAYNNTPNVMAETLVKVIPEVKNAARADHGGDYTVRHGEKVLRAQGRIVDPAFLTMFTFPLTKGSIETALAAPNHILLTESMATRLFGTTNVVGKTLLLDNQETMTVTGLLQNVPTNSRLQFDVLMP